MTQKYVSYDLLKVKEGFVARCSTNDKVTAFGIDKESAGNNLVTSIQEYLKQFPEKEEEILNTPMKSISV